MSEACTRREPATATAPGRSRRRHVGQEQRDRRRRLVTWSLSFTLVILLVNAIVGQSGYLATVRARRQYDLLATNVSRIRTENAALQAQGQRLQTDPLAIEEAARRELNLMRPGETLIIIRDVKPPTSSPASHDR